MSRSALLLALLVLGLVSASTPAEPLPAGSKGKLSAKFTKIGSVDVTVSPTQAKWGETVTVTIKVTPKPEAHSWTYPANPKDPKQLAKNVIEFPEPGDLVFIGTVTDPQVDWKFKPRDENEPNGPKDQYTEQPVTWQFKAVVSPTAKAGQTTLAFKTSEFQVCDKNSCVPAKGKELPTATLEIVEAASDKVNPEDLAAALDVLKIRKTATTIGPNTIGTQPTPSAGITEKVELRKSAKPPELYAAEMKTLTENISGAEKTESTGLGPFILTAALWGLISLVTPCVFPMIPITVSIFLKQAHGSLRERLKLAAVYSLTIILVLGVSAFALLKFMAILSAHPVTNVLLAALFLVLSLSLFGMYELALPNSLQKRLQAKQSKGGVVGTFFGALAFTVISFTCVAPFLGGFAGISAGNEGGTNLIVVPTAREIAGGLAFATAFAAPFFVLALVPGLIKALPKSGGWLDSVKVVMGFLELAAALKFLRTAELRILPTPQYFTYDVVLGSWVVISAVCGLYLLNVFRLPHDEEKPNIGVPRLLFAVLFLGLAVYLAPALFKGFDGKPQRPAGTVYAWVESFLLPEVLSQSASGSEVGWGTDLNAALEASRKSGKPVFLDCTGVTCTNCSYNEQNVFPTKAVTEEFQKFERVQLYMDEVPVGAYTSDPGRAARVAEADSNYEFQVAVFKDNRRPLYAVLMPQSDGKVKVTATYDEGKINDTARFVAFLKESHEKAKGK